jgi:hypothetical protein
VALLSGFLWEEPIHVCTILGILSLITAGSPCVGCASCDPTNGDCSSCNAGYGLSGGVTCTDCSLVTFTYFSAGVTVTSYSAGGTAVCLYNTRHSLLITAGTRCTGCASCNSMSGACSSCHPGFGFNAGSCTDCSASVGFSLGGTNPCLHDTRHSVVDYCRLSLRRLCFLHSNER